MQTPGCSLWGPIPFGWSTTTASAILHCRSVALGVLQWLWNCHRDRETMRLNYFFGCIIYLTQNHVDSFWFVDISEMESQSSRNIGILSSMNHDMTWWFLQQIGWSLHLDPKLAGACRSQGHRFDSCRYWTR